MVAAGSSRSSAAAACPIFTCSAQAVPASTPARPQVIRDRVGPASSAATASKASRSSSARPKPVSEQHGRQGGEGPGRVRRAGHGRGLQRQPDQRSEPRQGDADAGPCGQAPPHGLVA